MGISVAAAAIGFLGAWYLYYKRTDLPAKMAASAGGLYTFVLDKYKVDEFYGAAIIRPIVLASTNILWKGIDATLIDGAVNESAAGAQDVSDGVRQMQSGQHTLVCRMGCVRRGCRNRLHGVEGCAMNYINHNILTIVTFLPLLGALLLVIFPRRDRDIRWFALGISLVTLLASLHLPWYFQRGQTGFQFEQNIPWISHPNINYHLGIDGISLWLGRAHDISDAALRADLVEVDTRPGERILHPDAGARNGDDRRVRRARPVPFLFLLGSHAHPDGAHHRHLRARAPHLCGSEVFPVHDDCFGIHAGRAYLALRAHRKLRLRHDPERDSERTDRRLLRGSEVALPGILRSVCRKGTAVPAPHLAAGCARGSAHRGFRPAGRCAAEDGHVRPAAL